MNYWLLKSEPSTFSWNDLVKKGKDCWDGVRNYQARNNLKTMEINDLAFFYHSVNNPCIVGVAKIVSTHYPDPTTDDPRWVVVDVEPLKKLDRTISLGEVKSEPFLSDMILLKNSRLSVQPVTKEQFEYILKMSEVKE